MLKLQLEPAFILHTRPWRDTSHILECLTRDHGRIAIITRGTRRPKSPLKGLMQPFTPLLVSGSGKGEMLNLNQAERGGQPVFLEGDSLICGLYLNELLMQLCHRHDPHPEIFEAYGETLTQLLNTEDLGLVLRLFERDVLAMTGYGLVLDVEVEQGDPIKPEAWYRYHPEQGPIRENSMHASGIRIQGRALLALNEGDLKDADSGRQARNLMRQLLRHYTQGHEFKSRALFRR